VRVLFVYRYLTLGGVEAVLRARVHGLEAQGIEAQVWFLQDGVGRSLFDKAPDRLHIGGLNDLQRYLEGWPPDVVSVIDTNEALEMIAGVATRVPVILECHTPYAENRVYLQWASRGLVRLVLVPSQHQADRIRSKAERLAPIRVVPNPVGEHFLTPLATDFPPDGRSIVAWIGRLDYLKNWTHFLDIGGAILRREPKTQFWLIGDSPWRSTTRLLLGRSRRSGVLGSLRWFRGLSHDRLPRFLDAVRSSGGLVISTSRGEAFGMTIAEAMARECAVLAPNEGPFPEYVRDRVNGLLYKPGSVADAADRAVEVLQNGELRQAIGRQARVDILETFAPERALAVLARELRSVVGQPAEPVGVLERG
jgi:glycosyltransferase involved in cell wall biosynthesis